MKRRQTRSRTALELQMDLLLTISPDVPAFEIEYHFARPDREWRFDFAWPGYKLALEVQGGTWKSGAHSRGRGYEADREKINWAEIHGWHVLEATTDMVADGRALTTIEAWFNPARLTDLARGWKWTYKARGAPTKRT